jgi:SRSO17 transposase
MGGVASEIKQRIRPLFKQERVARNVGLFLEGLLGDEQRKTGWMRAEAAGDPGPWGQQAILGRRDWDADALCDIVRGYVIEQLADDDAVQVIDETGFLKRTSVVRSGAAIHGFGRQDHELPDRCVRVLRLPPWPCVHRSRAVSSETIDRRSGSAESRLCASRCRLCNQTKACNENARARHCRASVPFRWVAGDTVYGVGDIEQQLRRAAKGFVLGVRSAHVFRSWGKRRSVAGKAEDIAWAQPVSGWKRLSAGTGTKGSRLHDWCYLELADLETEASNDTNEGLWTRGLLVRRHIADGDLAFFTTWCPAGTSLETLVAVEGHRWAIEDSFETAKNEFGFDHTESRTWQGWHRHVSLVMLAFAMMAAIRHRANPPSPKKNQAPSLGSSQSATTPTPDPLVDPGSPPHRYQTRSKAASTCTHHRMAILAQGTSGRSPARSSQKTTTVMLGPVFS